eukprot:COSAG06_NODE_181_length_20926_cov_7.590051_21_plen_210_part_00
MCVRLWQRPDLRVLRSTLAPCSNSTTHIRFIFSMRTAHGEARGPRQRLKGAHAPMPSYPWEHVQLPPLQLPWPPQPDASTHAAWIVRLTNDRLVSTCVTSSSVTLPPGFERNLRPPPAAGGSTVPWSRVSSPSSKYTHRLFSLSSQSACRSTCATCPAPACTVAQSSPVHDTLCPPAPIPSVKEPPLSAARASAAPCSWPAMTWRCICT